MESHGFIGTILKAFVGRYEMPGGVKMVYSDPLNMSITCLGLKIVCWGQLKYPLVGRWVEGIVFKSTTGKKKRILSIMPETTFKSKNVSLHFRITNTMNPISIIL